MLYRFINIITVLTMILSYQKQPVKTQLNKLFENNVLNPIFLNSDIPEYVYKDMLGKSIPIEYKTEVDIKELSYLKISYWGYDNNVHIGEMIVNKKVSDEVIEIFKELFNAKYKIEKIKLIDEYDADDEKSMEDNNSSAFCYRKIANSEKLSKHALGLAIDINPLYNPYIVGSNVLPVSADAYKQRNREDERYIKKGDVIYNAFIKRGWTWGGDWEGKKDYQHFEKEI